MSNYTSQEQLKKITRSFSEIFDIGLGKVRHKTALKEGFKSHEAHMSSLPKLKTTMQETEIDIILPEKSKLIQSVQMRPGIFGNLLTETNMYSGTFDTVFGSLVSNLKSLGGKKDLLIALDSDKKTVNIKINTSKIVSEDFDSEKDKIDFFKKYLVNGSRDYMNSFSFGKDDASFRYKINSSFDSLFFVNALSKEFELVYKTNDGIRHQLNYENGLLVNELITKENTKEEVLNISFKLNDKHCYQGEDFSIEHMIKLIKDFNGINENITIECRSNEDDFKMLKLTGSSIEKLFHNKFNGLKRCKLRQIESKPVEGTCRHLKVAYVKTKTDEDFECVSYVNDLYTRSGGTHEKALKKYLKREFKDNKDLKGIKAVMIYTTPRLCLLKGGDKHENNMEMPKIMDLFEKSI